MGCEASAGLGSGLAPLGRWVVGVLGVCGFVILFILSWQRQRRWHLPSGVAHEGPGLDHFGNPRPVEERVDVWFWLHFGAAWHWLRLHLGWFAYWLYWNCCSMLWCICWWLWLHRHACCSRCLWTWRWWLMPMLLELREKVWWLARSGVEEWDPARWQIAWARERALPQKVAMALAPLRHATTLRRLGRQRQWAASIAIFTLACIRVLVETCGVWVGRWACSGCGICVWRCWLLLLPLSCGVQHVLWSKQCLGRGLALVTHAMHWPAASCVHSSVFAAWQAQQSSMLIAVTFTFACKLAQ